MARLAHRVRYLRVRNPCPAAPNDIRGTHRPAVLHFAPGKQVLS